MNNEERGREIDRRVDRERLPSEFAPSRPTAVDSLATGLSVRIFQNQSSALIISLFFFRNHSLQSIKHNNSF